MPEPLADAFARIYFQTRHPASFGSAQRLFRASRQQNPTVKLTDVQRWLSGQETYSLHRVARKKFPRRKTIVRGIDHQWQIDIASMQNLKKYNSGYNYLLTIIDVFSRYAWALMLKTKTGIEVANALEALFLREKRQPKYLHSDMGGEFRNKNVARVLDKYGIKLFSVHSEPKAALIERWNRTLKTKMYRYFTKNNTYRYVDVLHDLVAGYNGAKHRITAMAPDQVTSKNERSLWRHLYGKEFSLKANFAFQKGDTVRISQVPKTFDKGYVPRWTREYFVVAHRSNTKPHTYKLRDEEGKLLNGSFYEMEMQRIKRPSEDAAYDVDILKRRRRKNKTEYFVHYRGWPSSFDEWVQASQLEKR